MTDVSYEKIKIIRNRKTKNFAWLWVMITAVGILSLVDLSLGYFGLINATVTIIEEVGAALVLVMLIPALRTQEFYWFLDADKNCLANIEVDNDHKKTIHEAIRLVKQKTQIISEAYLSDLPLSTPSVFQITELDFPDFLNRVKIGFYEDKIITSEKSLMEEATLVIKYDELSGKTKTARIGNEKWDNAWVYWLLFVCITYFLSKVFFAEQMRGNLLSLQLFFGTLLPIVPMFFLKYVKSEILIFYDKKDNSVFWIEVNSANREKINQIVAFVQEKAARDT
jgi:hypothetical protein